MSDKQITIVGTIASIFGLLLSIITIVFTEYKVASLISLLIFETAWIIVWVYYVRRKHRIIFPYNYEAEVVFMRYVLKSESDVEHECIKVLKVTSPNLTDLLVHIFWTDRGDIHIESDFFRQNIDYGFDNNTGEISFYYPIPSPYKFGDTAIIHYRMRLEDKANLNRPEMSYQVMIPTKLCVMEVVLEYKDSNPPASFNHRHKDAQTVSLMIFQKDKEVPFDEATRSYRVTIPNPITNYTYQLRWEK